MHDSKVAAEFAVLHDRIIDAHNREPDPHAMEPLFVRVLNLIEESPTCVEFFVGEFVAMTSNLRVETINFIEFCMHKLRWTEVLNEASRNQPNTTELQLKWKRHIVESFCDTWVGRHFFEYYNDGNPFSRSLLGLVISEQTPPGISETLWTGLKITNADDVRQSIDKWQLWAVCGGEIRGQLWLECDGRIHVYGSQEILKSTVPNIVRTIGGSFVPLEDY